MLYAGAVFRLTGAFCRCPAPVKYSWNVVLDAGGHPELMLYCPSCTLRLVVPHNKFVASVEFVDPPPPPPPEPEPKKMVN